MLYDNVFYLSEVFFHFLLDNPDLLHDTSAPTALAVASIDDDAEATLSQRLEEWLERETSITDPTHRATLWQLATSYEALAEMRDTPTTSAGL